MKRNHLSTAATIALLAFSVLGVTAGDADSSVSTTPAVVPPPTNQQTTNATLKYDVTNRLTENGTTCTYEWGPMFTLYRTPDKFSFDFSSTSPIDVYVFSSYYYNGTLSCSLGPYAPDMPDNKPALTGERGEFGSTCMGCTPGSSDFVLFINRDATVTPHVTLEVAVKLNAITTTTVVTPPPSAIPFIGVPEALLAILLGLFVVVRRRSEAELNRN